MDGDDSRRTADGRGLDLDDIALREQRAARMPSLVVGAARAGVEYGVASVGLADVDGGVAAGPAVSYRIGSITKTFTAAVVVGVPDTRVKEREESDSAWRVTGTHAMIQVMA